VTIPRGSRFDLSFDESGGRDDGDRNVVGLLTDIVMLPVTVFLYGMELLLRAMQGTESATREGLGAMVAAPRPAGGGGGDDSDPGGAGRGRQRNPSVHDGGPERSAEKEASAMDTSIGYESRRDRDLRDDTLKLVRYKILFVRRELEVAFPEEEDLVYDNMDAVSFAAWKVAEFIQRMHNEGVRQPARWQARGYPGTPDDPACRTFFKSDGLLAGLPDEDKKYLRVYYEVLDRYPREKFRHDEQHIRVLEQIRDKLGDKNACGPSAPDGAGGSAGGTGAGGGTTGSGGTGGEWVVR